MIHLREMTEDVFSEYKPLLIEEYAQDIGRNYQIPIEEARAGSARQIDGLLSNGLSTPNQLLYEILLEEGTTETCIGYIWLDVDEVKRRCFICDIYLFEILRGKGWGRKTLELLEERMVERNIQKISLHVFADNTIARELYNKLGYQVTGMNMQKWLAK